MIEEIQQQLKILERERSIEILLAVESGSRAWGFPSPDSDFDVRIIYAHPRDYYLSIAEARKDTIEFFHGELLDINGWDIRKSLRLLSKSNATPAEWCQSPIVYQNRKGFRELLFEQVNTFFQAGHTFNHYRGIAINNFKINLAAGEEIKLKKLFYVIRPLLAAKWITVYSSVPPMVIHPLLELVTNKSIHEEIEQLIALKANVNEDYIHTISPSLLDFITNQFSDLNSIKLDQAPRPELDPLNEFFRSLIY